MDEVREGVTAASEHQAEGRACAKHGGQEARANGGTVGCRHRVAKGLQGLADCKGAPS